MKDFETTKRGIISELFAGREGFTDDVLDAITASFLFFDEKFPKTIDDSEIPDVSEFKIDGENGKRTLSNIYLNRIYNNVKKVDFTHFSSYNPEERKVNVENDISARVKIWEARDDFEKGEKIIKQKIKAKLIVHELIHAASDNGFMTGFTVTIGGKARAIRSDLTSKYSDVYKSKNAWSYQLEEAITEILALNIVESNILNSKIASKGEIVCRNPESSNWVLNSFAEYFYRIYPDCVVGKFTDGLLWNNQFEEEYLNNWEFQVKGKTQMVALDLYLSDIASDNPKTNIINTISSFQQFMLNDYIAGFEIKDKNDLSKKIKDYTAFRMFAGKYDKSKTGDSISVDRNGVDEKLSQLLGQIKGMISAEAEKLSVDREDINEIVIAEQRRLKSSDGKEVVFEPPYSQQIKKCKTK